MPTNQNVYNSRVTDEAIEKRFRDTFTSRGGSELVSDLYAQGVIVPIVDFTAAATGDTLAQNLQTAWDFSTGYNKISNTTTTLINTTGFWQVDLTLTVATSSPADATVRINDGLGTKNVFVASNLAVSQDRPAFLEEKFVVFLRAGDSLEGITDNLNLVMNIWYRQIADVNGNLTDPLGFTSS